MDQEGIELAYIFGCIAMGSFLVGLLIRTGKVKNWWLLQSNPVVPRVVAHLGLPFSISSFVLAISFLLPNVEDATKVTNFGFFLTFIAYILAMWRPRWLTPKWLVWLETNHNDIIPLLRDEARELGGRKWSQQIATQAGLEEWVAEVRRKRGL